MLDDRVHATPISVHKGLAFSISGIAIERLLPYETVEATVTAAEALQSP
jgi:hypothetical protein